MIIKWISIVLSILFGAPLIIWLILKLNSLIRIKIRFNESDYRCLKNIKFDPSEFSVYQDNIDYDNLYGQIIMRWFEEIGILKRGTNLEHDSDNIGDYGKIHYSQKHSNYKSDVQLNSINFSGNVDFMDNYKVIQIKTAHKDKYINAKEKWLIELSAYLYMSSKSYASLICYSYENDFIKNKFRIMINKNSDSYQDFININDYITQIKNANIEFIKYKPESISDSWKIKKINRRRKKR